MTPEPVHERRKRTFKVALPKMLVGMALYLASGWRTFTLMKPVRGIETEQFAGSRTVARLAFTLMKPVRGIETLADPNITVAVANFHINETRSRD